MKMKEFVEEVNSRNKRRNEIIRFVKVFQKKDGWYHNVSQTLDVHRAAYEKFDKDLLAFLASEKKKHPSDPEFRERLDEICNVKSIVKYIDENFMDLEANRIISEIGKITNITYSQHLLKKVSDALRPYDIMQLGMIRVFFKISMPSKRGYNSNHLRGLFKAFGRKPVTEAEAASNMKAMQYIVENVAPSVIGEAYEYLARAFAFVYSENEHDLYSVINTLPETIRVTPQKGMTTKIDFHPRTTAKEAVISGKFFSKDQKKRLVLILS